MADHNDRSNQDRREFLRRIAPLLPAAALSACGWDGGKTLQPVFDKVIAGNNKLGQKLQSIRNAKVDEHQAIKGKMPSYCISTDSSGKFKTPVLDDPASWRLEVGGLVRKPGSFSAQALAAMPHLDYSVTHHCVEGWSAVAQWSGVPFAVLADHVEPLPTAQFVQFDSFDSGYMNGWDIESAMHPQTILADGHGGQPITPYHGAPLRLYSPLKLGYKLTKYLTRITFTDKKPGGYWEDKGYPWFGGI